MRIVIRADASVWIGSGHIMRCLVLAEKLCQLGHDVHFACLSLEGNLFSVIKQRGFSIVELSQIEQPLTPRHKADYAGWLHRSQKQDASDFIVKVKSADVVITDHYGIDHVWQNIVRRVLKCKIVTLDDLQRCHDADLIIDQTLGCQSVDYVSGCRVLAGTQYALISDRFSQLRQSAFSRQKSVSLPNVLVSMGGIDAPNATTQVLKALIGRFDANFTVLLSSRSPNYHYVQSIAEQYPNITHIDFTNEMAKLMLQHDISIGAPGSTSWERASLGLPNIIIPLADNQKEICFQLTKVGASLTVSLQGISKSLLPALNKVYEHWERYHQANLDVCDGLGAERVISEINALLTNDQTNREFRFQLVRAKADDIAIVYEWQRHPSTRRFALNREIPSWEEHSCWMADKLRSYKDYFYIVREVSTGMRVGGVRLDKIDDGYLISIFIDPYRYGQGIATEALKLIDELHGDSLITAAVLRNNVASQQLFLNAKYKRVSEEAFIREPLRP